jgi:hypothetical protein
MRKMLNVFAIVLVLAICLSGCAKTESQNADSTPLQSASPSEVTATGVVAETPPVSTAAAVEASESLEQWIGAYWFSETNADNHELRYEISIYKKDDAYLAHFYIFGFRTMNEFQASVYGKEASADLVFEEYVNDNYSEPFKKGDLLLTLKKDNGKLLTDWSKIQPMLQENESDEEHFQKADSEESGTDISNKEVQCLKDTVLVNELDSNEKELFYLGMTKDDLMSILDKDDIYYYSMESDPGPGGMAYDNSCLYYFLFFEDEISVHVDEDAVDYIEMRGSVPLKTTSTKAGLYLGDPVEKMIELYGSDYTVGTSAIPGEEMYEVYKYQMAEYYFYVYFLDDTVARWGISSNKYAFVS